MEALRICIDLDGVICNLKKPGQSYADLIPIEGAVEKIRQLNEHGHYIIIYTARHMKTCNGNIGKVSAKIGKITFEWLEKYGTPYDEVIFGKPWCDVYIDDNVMRFEGWDQIVGDGSNLTISKEKQL